MASEASLLQKILLDLGNERLREILQDFYRAMSRDLMIGFFFDGKNTDAIAENQLLFLLKAAGITKKYSGRAPASAHLSLSPILTGHFNRRIEVLRKVLAEAGLQSNEIDLWVTFESQFKDVIVARDK